MPAEEQQRKDVREQYATPVNLATRSRLHSQYSTNKYGWSRWVFDFMLKLSEQARVLEVGCGDGGLWRSNAHRIPSGWSVTLSDSSPGMVQAASAALSKCPSQFRFLRADVESLPFEDAEFDAVVANHMLYHTGSVDGAVAEIRRVLVPGGTVFATTNGRDHLAELRKLVEPLAPELPFVLQDNAAAFSLENGKERLSSGFSQIRLHRYEDSLEVPEVEPLVGWVMSVRLAGDMLAGKEPQLRSALSQMLRGRGSIQVTKSQGLFIAS